MKTILPALLLALVAMSCSNRLNLLKKQAAVDLTCSPRALEIEELDRSKAGGTYLVTGCERSAQYTVTRKGIPTLASAVASAPRPPPPQPVVVVAPAPAPPPQQFAAAPTSPAPNFFTTTQAAAPRATYTCCVNRRSYSCADAQALDQCSGAFSRCMLDCMGKSMSCADGCAKNSPPNPRACTSTMNAC